MLVDFNDQAFNLLFLTWWSDGHVPEWEEYWHEKYESPDYLFYFNRPYLYIVSLRRGKYGLLILLVNWSPGIIALAPYAHGCLPQVDRCIITNRIRFFHGGWIRLDSNTLVVQ